MFKTEMLTNIMCVFEFAIASIDLQFTSYY